MAVRMYATPEELKEYLKLEEEPDDAEDLIVEAGEEIDDILLASRYPVDSDGMPTDPKHIEAMKRATLVQAKHRYEHGDEITISTSGGAMSLGPLRIGGIPGGVQSDDHQGIPQVPQRVFRILSNEGLLTTKVVDA